MKKNVGNRDRIIRYILALVFVYLGYVVSPWFYLAAVLLIITALAGFCGIYALFGIDTCKINR